LRFSSSFICSARSSVGASGWFVVVVVDVGGAGAAEEAGARAGFGVPSVEVWPEPEARFLRGEEAVRNVCGLGSVWFEGAEEEVVVVTTGESAMVGGGSCVERRKICGGR
jgi:hypothetical protein